MSEKPAWEVYAEEELSGEQFDVYDPESPAHEAAADPALPVAATRPPTYVDTRSAADHALAVAGVTLEIGSRAFHGALGLLSTIMCLGALYLVAVADFGVVGLFIAAICGFVAYRFLHTAFARGSAPKRAARRDSAWRAYTLTVTHREIALRLREERARVLRRPPSGVVRLEDGALRADGSNARLVVRDLDPVAVAAALREHGWILQEV